MFYVNALTSLFQVSPTEKADILFDFFFVKSSFYAVCLIKKQNLIIHQKEDTVKVFLQKNGKPSAMPPSGEKHGSGLFFYGARRGI